MTTTATSPGMLRSLAPLVVVGLLCALAASRARAQEEPPPPPPPEAAPVPPPPVDPVQPPPGYGGYEAPPPPPPGGTYPAPAPVMQVPQEPEGVETHDGFFIRLALGLGYLSASEDTGAMEFTLRGGALGVSLGIGGAMAENLIVFGHLYGATATSPALEVDGEDRGDTPTTLSVSALAAGILYYFMPLNLYVGGSVGIGSATLTLDDLPEVGTTGAGFAFDALVGKEWWVGDQWCVGAGAELFVMSLPDAADSNLNVVGASVLFTATYN